MDSHVVAIDGKPARLIEGGNGSRYHLWRRMSLSGVDGLDDRQARPVKLTNQITVLIVVTTLCFNALYAAYDFAGLAPAILFNALCVLAYGVVLFLNHKRRHLMGSTLMCGVANLHLLVLCWMLGAVSRLNLFYFVPVYTLIFRPSEKIPLYGFQSLAVALYLTTAFLFPDGPGVLNPDATLIGIIQVASVTGAFLMIGAIVTLFSRDVLHAEALLAREYARSESLLLNVLPKAVVSRLKAGEATIADRIPGVSVVFIDIVGFTDMASRQTPAELVAGLDRFFGGIDGLVTTHGLEKIKTIGDAYMAVSGAPEPRDDHAQRAADFALEVRDSIEQLEKERGKRWEVRIGLHSGPVTAGVIGRRKFSYDIWGDTVNTASRLESGGVPGKIHVSRATRNLLKDAFVFEERGWVDIKGKGRMRTFFLVDRRTPGVSANANA